MFSGGYVSNCLMLQRLVECILRIIVAVFGVIAVVVVVVVVAAVAVHSNTNVNNC